MSSPLLKVEIPAGTLPETAMRIKLRKARLFAELSQAELGKHIGNHLRQPAISQQTIYRWERSGNIPAIYLGAISKACGVPFDFFRL